MDRRRERRKGGSCDVGLKLSEATPSSEREREGTKTPGDKHVTCVYSCIEQLLHKLTIKKPHLGSYHCR